MRQRQTGHSALRQPVQIIYITVEHMATLHRRYSTMLRLDGAGVGSDKQAAALLGMKGSTFPAKKAMQQSRALGTDKLARAIELLATADMQLRGTVDWPAELVMEVLVARLASLSGRR